MCWVLQQLVGCRLPGSCMPAGCWRMRRCATRACRHYAGEGQRGSCVGLCAALALHGLLLLLTAGTPHVLSLSLCCCRVWAAKAAPVSAWQQSGISCQPLSFSLLFSSIASLLGSAGQANYAAANASLDAAAAASQASGVPAVSLRWGAWAGVLPTSTVACWQRILQATHADMWSCCLRTTGAGMASSDIVKAKIASLGMALLQPAAGLAALEKLLTAPALLPPGGVRASLQAAAPVLDVVPFRWQRLLARHKQQVPELFADMAHLAVKQQQPAARTAAGQPSAGAARTAQAHRQQLMASVMGAITDVLGREVRTRSMQLRVLPRTCQSCQLIELSH